MENGRTDRKVLVTGGTSGLGKALVFKLLKEGFHVVSVSRNGEPVEIDSVNYNHYSCDLADLSNVDELIRKLDLGNISIDILINNAGVLSPPEYLKTGDGLEYSYQVNFLAQVYLTVELLERGILDPRLIINVSSPMHTKGNPDLSKALDPEYYGIFKAYSNTKLYMALYSKKLADEGIKSFSFNPGTFSSGIYRQQRKWFHFMYKIAAPFMTSSRHVADCLYRIVCEKRWINGEMMNKKGKQTPMPEYSQNEIDNFWLTVTRQIENIRQKISR
ncbi:MAG: SDR family NAD(P)-dependent oxidoreductase [Cytophagales bacterium]|nr:SDR family NAD(P)-dependent oxidoreductase [Cytophagales bacterium]